MSRVLKEWWDMERRETLAGTLMMSLESVTGSDVGDVEAASEWGWGTGMGDKDNSEVSSSGPWVGTGLFL